MGTFLRTFLRTFMRDDKETLVEVEIAVNNWGCSAQTYGPAEDCYPAEGIEVELLNAYPLGGRCSSLTAIKLTDAEMQRAEIEFMEDPPEDDWYDDCTDDE